MRHVDLFSGIGGFALAVEEVWPKSEHIFCDNDKYCQQLLKLRFPNSKIYGDIREIKTFADIDRNGLQKQGEKQQAGRNKQLFENTFDRILDTRSDSDSYGDRFTIGKKKINPAEAGKQTFDGIEGCIDILTGGFPCQPFSQAGKRRGTEDNRYLWPEMLRVIQLAKPQWVIAENVRGLLTLQSGMVFEQVCFDLEASGYEVQPFIIPAVAVNAPHRRDRIWFVAHAVGNTADRKKKRGKLFETASAQKQNGAQYGSARQSLRAAFGEWSKGFKKNKFMAERNDASDAESERSGRRANQKCGVKERELEQSECKGSKVRSESKRCSGKRNASNADTRRIQRHQRTSDEKETASRDSWERNWLEAATEFCGVDDGLPAKLDGFELSKSRHRTERLKALGNAIVPQVAIEIMKAIKKTDENRAM